MRARRRIGLFQPESHQADVAVRIERRDQIPEIGLMEFRDDGAGKAHRRFDRIAQLV
jgi:hypothetical protein